MEQLTRIENDRDSLSMGSYGHKLLETYYKGIALGSLQSEAYVKARDISSKNYNLTNERKAAVLERFQYYWMKYSNSKDIEPLAQSKYAIKVNPSNGLPIDTIEKIPLVELGFSYRLLDTSEYLFVLEGMIDLIGLLDGMKVFMDHKWQDRRRSLYKKSIQFRNYSLVTKSFVGIVNYVRMAQKMDSSTFEREIISFSPGEIRQWKEELTEIFINICKSANSEEREQRWGSCSGKFGYPCEFTKLCEEFNPNIKENIKMGAYKKKELWQPWKLAEIKVEV